MARTIAQVAHDLKPMVKLVNDISEQLKVLLPGLQKKCNLSNKEIDGYFADAIEGIANLHESADLISQYVNDVEHEAEEENIPKSY